MVPQPGGIEQMIWLLLCVIAQYVARTVWVVAAIECVKSQVVHHAPPAETKWLEKWPITVWFIGLCGSWSCGSYSYEVPRVGVSGRGISQAAGQAHVNVMIGRVSASHGRGSHTGTAPVRQTAAGNFFVGIFLLGGFADAASFFWWFFNISLRNRPV